MTDFLEPLREFWAKRREEVNRQFKRTLPFGDYVVDRWDKAKALGFGENSSVYDSAHIFGDVKVGRDTWIGPFTILDGSGELTIGNNCSISAGVQLYTHDTVGWATSGGVDPYEYAPTVIGNNCYIGPNTVVTKGVTIGEGAVVGANSLVIDNVAQGQKVAGSPARKLRKGGHDDA